MKSSEPLFTRQNPFRSSSRLKKTHYHPSRAHSLSKAEKETVLSPVRFDQPSSSNLPTQKLVETQKRCSRVTAERPVFTESWPASTDCDSSPTSSIACHDMESIAPKVTSGKTTISSERVNWQESDLTKSREHFRDSPLWRREEEMDYSIDEQQLSFWQTSPSSVPPSSTPTKAADMYDYPSPDLSPAEGRLRDECLSPCRELPSILSESEADDAEILHLQERATRLLLREECLSDGPIRVSSEGLESSDFSSSASIDELQQRYLISVKARPDSEPAASSLKSVVPPSLVTPHRREEDILFQWRLRRKMEQAREGPRHAQQPSLHGPTFSWQTQTLNQPAADGALFKHQQSTRTEYSTNPTRPHMRASQSEPHASSFQAPGASPGPAFVASGSSVSQPQSVASVPAHMHFLCDVLPCPIQPSHASRPPMISQDISMSHVKTKVPENKLPHEPVLEVLPLSQPTSFATKEGGVCSRHKRPERKKKERVCTKASERPTATRRLKKSSVDREHVEALGSTNESRSHERVTRQPEHRKSRRDVPHEAAAPSSPIHSALGQVVSEVLFPSADSSSHAHRAPTLPGSPARPPSVPPQSSGPPRDTRNPAEVIARLLQAADDSDETEFEEDPLLQVLRRQRTWVREQISQVDSVFSELLEEQQGTSLMRDA